MGTERIYKVKAFMDSFKSEEFNNLCEPILDCIPFHYEDEIWEFELVIRKVKKLPFENEFQGVEIKEVSTSP